MSSAEQSLDPTLIEQTKMQIRTLVKEIAQLSKTESTPEKYFAEFLPRVVSALAAVGGAVWTVEEQGQLSLQYQINLQETRLRDDEEANRRHSRLLYETLQANENVLVQPRSGQDSADGAANPTDFLIVMGPVHTELETVALIEIFQRPGAGPKTQSGYLNFLNQVTQLAGDFFKTRQLRNFGDRQLLWTQLEEFTRVIHSSLDPSETAFTIANEGRRLIECDRVSLAIRRGRKCVVEAVSGQDLFDKRSNLIRLMGELSTAVVKSEEAIWYTGNTLDLAPQVEEAIQEYADESHSKTVAVIPLFSPETDEQKTDDIDEREKTDPPFGALIVEQIEDSRVPEKMRKRVDVVIEHSRLAMHNALEHNSLFLMPLWRMIGKSKVLVKARNLPKTLSISAAILAAVVAMFVIRWDFDMHGDGTLEPVVQQNVFAAVDDGQVQEIYVHHGKKVQGPDPATGYPGQELCRLTSHSLEQAVIDINGRLAENFAELGAVNRALSDTQMMRPDQVNELQGRYAELNEQRKSLYEQLAVLKEKEKDLLVRAPITGEITTWDLNDRLFGRPVQRGQVLMQIADADPSDPWQVELLMPEKRMGNIMRHQKRVQDADPEADLVVEFVLATDPNHTFEGKVIEIHEMAEVRGEEGNTVLIKVEISPDEKQEMIDLLGPAVLRPGASVSAKIPCGKRSLGYVLLYDAFAYVQQNIIFRWF